MATFFYKRKIKFIIFKHCSPTVDCAQREKILQQNFKIFGMNNRSGSPLLPEENTFGRFQFVWEAPGIALTSVLILAIAALVGTFGNLLILVSVCHTIYQKKIPGVYFRGELSSVGFIRYTHCRPYQHFR